MLDMADLPGAETLKISQFEEAELNEKFHETSEFVYDMISYNDSNHCRTIDPNGDMYYKQINEREQEAMSEDRTVLCIVMKNGELIPAWNGSHLLRIASKKEDLQYNLPVDYELKPGEYALMSYTLFDLSLDAFDQQCFRLFHGLEE